MALDLSSGVPAAAHGRFARPIARPEAGETASTLSPEGLLVPRTVMTRLFQLLAAFAVGMLSGIVLAFHMGLA